MTNRTRRNTAAFYSNLATTLLQVRLQQLSARPYPNRDDFERIYLIKQVLQRRAVVEAVSQPLQEVVHG